MSSYELTEDEKLYVPDTWVEENPTCPVHEEKLYSIPCEKTYMGRKVSFTGHFCEKCNKIIIRKAVAVDLIDECAMAGVPEIETERIAKTKPKKKVISPKEIRPDYFIEDGKKTQYNYAYNVDCYKLTEEDTVVISDSIYCNLLDHNTEESLALIMVKERKDGKKAYLFMVGYCDQCQKYYIDEVDYKAIYNLGRPEVNLLIDSDADSYQITSGEVFNLEKIHLNGVENSIQGEIDTIHSKPDYVSQYAVGSYDDGNLSYAKKVSKTKYEPRLEQLQEYIPKPYNYRVDITADGKTEVFYIGASDIDIDGERKVISFNSDFGHKLVNYQTVKIERNGKEHNIKLSRQFDIDRANLYGYMNLRTDEDIIFRSGVTDPFLVRVLNMRKKQHNLIDIIATIQENQNRIVDEDFNKNMIVQGCAGSGKTMVLLHRLSSLQYRHNYYDFGENAMILTPNDEFTLHIKGLAEGLQIGNIERISVEQYYINILLRYSEEFKLENKLSSEMFVPQTYVDYIYSDQFKDDFNRAYDKVITQRNMLGEILDNLTDAMDQPRRNINYTDTPNVVEQMKLGIDAMDSLVKQRESEISIAEEEYNRIVTRQQFLEDRIPKSEEFASNIVKETTQRVWAKIASRIDELKQKLEIQEKELQQLLEERQRIQGTIIMFGKRARLEDLDKRIAATSRKIADHNKQMEEEKEVYSTSLDDKTDTEILAWMRKVMLYIKDVQNDIRLCQNTKQELISYKSELAEIPGLLSVAKEKFDKVSKLKYRDEVPQAIQYLREKLNEYTTINTYQFIFDEAVSEFKTKHNIKKINGKYHRYGLYARLLFAMKYYNTHLGSTRFMCVDEGQDLAFNEYMLLYELNQKNVTFNIFGDTNQLIKPGRGIADWSELKITFGAEEYILNENYRNTNQITRFCNNSFNMSVLQTGVDGAKVREISRRELEDELSSLHITTERIAILVPRGVQKKKYLDSSIIPGNIYKLIGETMENGRIAFKYVDEVKGIEFDKVYVVANKMSRNEKYIAYTRALSELILVVDENVDDYNDGMQQGEEDVPEGKSPSQNQEMPIKNEAMEEDTFLENNQQLDFNAINSEGEFSDSHENVIYEKDVNQPKIEEAVADWDSAQKDVEIQNKFIIEDDRLIGFVEANQYDEVVIPSGIKSIENRVFLDCSFRKIVIPDGVEELGTYAFSDCTKLEEVVLPDSIIKIGWGSFKGCVSLKEMHISENVKKLGGYAFDGCISMKKIAIPLHHYHRIADYKIPETCEILYYDNKDKENFYKEEDFIVHSDKKETKDNDRYDQVGDFLIKDRVLYKYVGSCWNEVIVPFNVDHIENRAFMGTDVQRVIISNGVKSLGTYVFHNCKELTEVVLPDSLSKIGWGTFKDCVSLKEISIPKGVKKMGGYTFDGCISLKKIFMPKELSFKSIDYKIPNDCRIEILPEDKKV